MCICYQMQRGQALGNARLFMISHQEEKMSWSWKQVQGGECVRWGTLLRPPAETPCFLPILRWSSWHLPERGQRLVVWDTERPDGSLPLHVCWGAAHVECCQVIWSVTPGLHRAIRTSSKGHYKPSSAVTSYMPVKGNCLLTPFPKPSLKAWTSDGQQKIYVKDYPWLSMVKPGLMYWSVMNCKLQRDIFDWKTSEVRFWLCMYTA